MGWDPADVGAIERLQVVYKIAERCNLDCSYCYYYRLGDKSALQRPAQASLQTTEDLAAWIAQGCRELQISQVIISFHGGEPMLMRALTFAKTCEIFVQVLAPVVDLQFSIQTNGTRLTEGWIEALTSFRVAVGVSIDGRRRDHDRFRLDHQGQSSFDSTECAIRKLVEVGATHPSVYPGTISVLHHLVDYRATYTYLRSLGIRSMHFLLPDRDGHSGVPEHEANAIGRGLLALFECWLREDDPTISIRFIDEALPYFTLAAPSSSPPRKHRKSNQILVARSDATIAVDDSMMPAATWYDTAPVFSTQEGSLKNVFRHPVFLRMENEKNRLPRQCAGCTWSDICRGGDIENRFSEANGFDNPSAYCQSYKVLFEGICRTLVHNGYPAEAINRTFGVLIDA